MLYREVLDLAGNVDPHQYHDALEIVTLLNDSTVFHLPIYKVP